MLARILTAAAASTLLLAAPARAEAEPVSAAIEIGDLDLASAHGQTRLKLRIANAVRQVCGEEEPLDLDSSRSFETCAGNVRADASQKVQTAMSSRGAKRIQVAATSAR
jgi:UrcA family protein